VFESSVDMRKEVFLSFSRPGWPVISGTACDCYCDCYCDCMLL
jgi:hypothetical protein